MRWSDLLGWAKREPLVLFILAGSMLFGAHALFAPALGWDDSSRRISVESSDLVRFLQLRSRLFDDNEAQQRFKRMSRAERLTLMDDYVREEVLYREALELGLDNQDYVVRRRLVQSAEYALTADVRQAEAPSLAALEEWYNSNRQLYSKAPGRISIRLMRPMRLRWPTRLQKWLRLPRDFRSRRRSLPNGWPNTQR